MTYNRRNRGNGVLKLQPPSEQKVQQFLGILNFFQLLLYTKCNYTSDHSIIFKNNRKFSNGLLKIRKDLMKLKLNK